MPDSLFTLIAQIVNFLVIVVVLRLLLFKRIVRAIDKRQEDISAKNDEADRRESEANERAQKLEKKNSEFHQERERLKKEARSKADDLKKELLEEAKTVVDDKRKQWLSQIEKESDRFIQESKKAALSVILDVSERMLFDLADDQLQDRMASKLISTIRNDKELKEDLGGSDKIAVKSSFSLSDKRKGEFKELLGNAEFLHADDFHGIRIELDGKRMEWTVESWLDSFEDNIQTRLNEMVESAGEQNAS